MYLFVVTLVAEHRFSEKCFKEYCFTNYLSEKLFLNIHFLNYIFFYIFQHIKNKRRSQTKVRVVMNGAQKKKVPNFLEGSARSSLFRREAASRAENILGTSKTV